MAALLAERAAACRRARSARRRSRAGCSPRSAVARSTCRRFRARAMDGFAVRAADTPGTLPVVFRIAAGRPASQPLRAGEAMGIATGGVVPEGADAVIPIEYVVDHDNEVEIRRCRCRRRERPSARRRCRRGPRWSPRPATPLRPAQLGALAAAGRAGVACDAASARRRSDDRNRASHARRASCARRGLRGQRVDARALSSGGGRLRRAAPRRSRTTRTRTGARSSAASRPTCSSPPAASPSGRTTSSAAIEAELGVRRGLLGRRGQAGKAALRSACGSARSSSGCPEIRSRRSWASSSSCGRRCSRSRVHADPRPPFEPGTLAAAVRRNAERDELLGADTAGDDGWSDSSR